MFNIFWAISKKNKVNTLLYRKNKVINTINNEIFFLIRRFYYYLQIVFLSWNTPRFVFHDFYN